MWCWCVTTLWSVWTPVCPPHFRPACTKFYGRSLGFSGVIVTDDLYMRGIRDFMGPDDAAVQAVLAGNDLLCCTEFEVQVPAVVEAVRHGVIDQAQVDASVLRILRLKQALGAVVKAKKVAGKGFHFEEKHGILPPAHA